MEQQDEQNNARMKKRQSWLAAATGLLFVAICITVAILGTRLAAHITDDGEAIALVPSERSASASKEEYRAEHTAYAGNTASDNDANGNTVNDGAESAADAGQAQGAENTQINPSVAEVSGSGSGTAAATQNFRNDIGFSEEVINVKLNPGMEVYDDQKTWTTATEVDIFKIAYENGEAVVTVDGMGDKVIAPGTGNAYTFYLKNTGNVMLDYTLEMEAYFTPDTQPIPVEARLKGYDGSYLLGSDSSWSDVLELNHVKDQASLSVNRYAYYTLEWQWPYESGDDAYDTFLGNMAVDEDLTLTIVIRTVATGEDMTTEIHRTDRVTTGDNANLLMWVGLAAGALVLLTILMIVKKCRKAEQEIADEKK